MKLEEHIVSLELSEQLKRAGHLQEGLFEWCHHIFTGGGDYWHVEFSNMETGLTSCGMGQDERITAPTVAELGERLPRNTIKYVKILNEKVEMWTCKYFDRRTFTVVTIIEKSEADSRAKLWIYLKKEKLIGE